MTKWDELSANASSCPVLDDHKYPCQFCGKLNQYMNYCDWKCIVNAAKRDGGKLHTPNGLPICSVKADGTMLEHEHGDHPDYKFPVEVEYVGPVEQSDFYDYEMVCGTKAPDDEAIRKYRRETHALIYTDGTIALTMYEHCYAMWHLSDGHWLGGQLWKSGSGPGKKGSNHRLNTEALLEFLSPNVEELEEKQRTLSNKLEVDNG